MAGGIEWFRWHHGSVTDPKFALVARIARASLPEVLAVWAFVLEAASAATERGNFGTIDAESLDCLFNIPDERTQMILDALEQRGLTKDGRVTAWEKRQPKRERDPLPLAPNATRPMTSTERSRLHRARKEEQPNGDMQRQATPLSASNAQETPREEKSRKEEAIPTPYGAGANVAPATPSTPAPSKSTHGSLFDTFWSAYPKKVDKKAALKAFENLSPTPETFAKILVALKAQAATEEWKKDGGQYIPYPASWLNGERWTDEGVQVVAAANTDYEQTQARLAREAQRGKSLKPAPEQIAALREVAQATRVRTLGAPLSPRPISALFPKVDEAA